MHSGLVVGAEAEVVWQVAAEHVIHLGYPPPSLVPTIPAIPVANCPSAVVFSTPNMILLMERAARKVIEPFLEAGEASVGATVNIEHLAGTPLGSEVRGIARVTAIDGRSIQFDVAAYDRHEQIGRGTHRRAVVRLEKVAQRMQQKAGAQASVTVPHWLQSVDAMPPTKSIVSRSAPERPLNNSATTPPQTNSPPMLQSLRLQVEGAIAIVVLDRAEKLNAVNIQMTADWEQLNVYLWHHPEIRVVLVSGAGDAFCAGDDVHEVGTLSLEQAQELSYRQARVYLAWEQLPQVFIAVVGGVALGAGCVAACACDLRIASHAAKFGMPEILLGWPPGYGIAQLTALIGKSKAMEMCLLGQAITGQQALELGLVQRLVASSSLMASARRWAEQLLTLPAKALRETKLLVHADEGLQSKTAFVADTAAYIRCLQDPNAREGIAAFKEKRAAKFQ